MSLSFSIDAQLEARLAQVLQQVEAELHSATQFPDPLAQVSAHHLMNAGGKRLRPLLALLAAQFGAVNPESDSAELQDLLDAAVVVELIHLATLYHDDVMDKAPLRRGAPSAHEVWGNHVAILTGDLLFARSSLIMSRLGPEAVKIQAQTFERLCLGQLHETVGAPADADPVEFYLQVLSDKTASLTAAAARLGAMFGGAPGAVQDALAAYGEALGVAFQLADDVLDYTALNSGKVVGTDLRDQVVTMPVLLLKQRVAQGAATSSEIQLVQQLAGDLSDDAVVADLISQIRNSSVIPETLALATSYSEAAIQALADIPDSAPKSALIQLAQAVVTRTA